LHLTPATFPAKNRKKNNNLNTIKMAQLNELKKDFHNAQEAFQNGLSSLRKNWEDQQQEKHGQISLEALNEEPADFSLYYCLSEALSQLDRKMAEKPSRELSLVKTKLQEALYWAEQAR